MRTATILCWTLAWAALAMCPPVALAQTGDRVAARAEALREVVARVTSPDPERNIAEMEAIVAEGDARAIELAVRALIEGDDPVMRGMAMRAYLAAARDLVLEVLVPPEAEEALRQFRDTSRSPSEPHRYLESLVSVQFQVTLTFEDAAPVAMRGHVRIGGAREPVEYVVRGARITFEGAVAFGRLAGTPCGFELMPAEGATIAGTMRCRHRNFTRPLALRAPMF